MKMRWIVAVAAVSLTLGLGIGVAASKGGAGIGTIRGKPAAEAGAAALAEAEHLAGSGSWEQIAVGRVYYLSGDKPRGQAIFDRISSGKTESSDWQRIGDVYADAHEDERAASYYKKVIELDPKLKDDTGRAAIGAWYIRIGQREQGEALLADAMTRNPGEVWHYVRAAEALLGVPAGR